MSRLIDVDALIKDFDKRCFGECCCCIESTNTESGCKVIDEQPTVDAIPISWINKHLEWLDNCDNDFAQLAKVSIRGMLELWRKDGMLNE